MNCLASSRLRDQFGNWSSLINDWRWSAVKVFDGDIRSIDAEVVIDRRQKISGTANPLDRVLAAFVGRSDEASGFDTATSPDIGERSWPMVAAWLLRSGWGTGVSGTCTRLMADLWRTTEFTSYNNQNSFVETSVINVFDQR